MNEFVKELSCECCILGAGPAGIGAAHELGKNNVDSIIVIDKNDKIGGLARTEVFDNIRFDVGPHRFFSKNQEINNLWHDTLGEDFKVVDRITRIYYKNKYFNYPIKPFDVLMKLSPVELFYAAFSFFYAKLFPNKNIKTFEDWVVNKFGWKLYNTFFKTYTEKVWGIPCKEIGADWAAQRIKGLDIFQIIKNSLLPGKNEVKTLVNHFNYPVLGAGQMYEVMYEKIGSNKTELLLNTEVIKFNREGSTIKSVDVISKEKEKIRVNARHFFNSIPLTHFFKMLNPPIEKSGILNAVDSLYYRDHITVNLLVDRENVFPDQWIYIHSPEVQMARIANYNNFSKAMVDYSKKTAISVEYFVFQHEDLWKLDDSSLIMLAIEELEKVNILNLDGVEGKGVTRETESYPTYYLGFREHYELLKSELDEFDNLYPVGRGGMYKYNNQDHSTISGILAARNYVKLPGSPYNLWNINIDAQYLESAED